MDECNIRQFTASDGYTFKYRHWKPEAKVPQAYVVALHGIQSHSGWYQHSCQQFCQAGIDVRFLDRRGSGLNDEKRGQTLHWERLTNDIRQFMDQLCAERDQHSPNIPIILLALSWGGKLGAMFAGHHSSMIDGLVLQYPGIYSRFYPSWWQRQSLAFAVWFGYRKKLLAIPLNNPELFTSQHEWQQFIRDDPRALHQGSSGLMNSSSQMDRLVGSTAKQIQCPVLVQLAAHDQIVDNKEVRKYFEQLSSTQKQLIEYPNSVHTLEFEPDRDAAIHDCQEWMLKLANNFVNPSS